MCIIKTWFRTYNYNIYIFFWKTNISDYLSNIWISEYGGTDKERWNFGGKGNRQLQC